MTTSKTSFNAYWLDSEGRIRNRYNERCLSTRVWPDEVSADYWLNFVSDDGKFGQCYIAGTLADADGLGRWLTRNGVTGDDIDAEMLDALPDALRDTAEQLLEGR